jgi:hypothetical protein
MPVQTQMQVRRGTASSWTSTNPTLAAGELGFETDTGKFKIGTGSSTWTGLAYATGLNAITYLYNATAAQTTFSGADANGLTLAYTVGTEQVFLNGALQVRGSDYTATNGTSIVLTSGALAGDVLNVIAYGATTITDTYTQAQADAKFFQTANAFLAGKNKVINGDFFINQRNTTSSTSTSTYLVDRFRTVLTAAAGSVTGSVEQFTAGTAPVAGYEAKQYCRIVTAGQAQTTDRAILSYAGIEDVRTFAGQTITISFWAKAATGTPSVAIEFAQAFGLGGSPSATVTAIGSAKTAITTSWARYSFNVSVPSISGKTIGTDPNSSALLFNIWTSAGSSFDARTASLGLQNVTIDLWGVQVEAGSIATPFQTATGTIQGELAACQRYYWRTTGALHTIGGGGIAGNTTECYIPVNHPVTMRVAPTSIDTANLRLQIISNSFAVTSTTISAAAPNLTMVKAYTASGLTATTQSYQLYTDNSATNHFGLSAEL